MYSSRSARFHRKRREIADLPGAGFRKPCAVVDEFDGHWIKRICIDFHFPVDETAAPALHRRLAAEVYPVKSEFFGLYGLLLFLRIWYYLQGRPEGSSKKESVELAEAMI